VWSLLVHVLTTYVTAHALLCDRHVDQLILCAIYGVCKVQQRAVTFRAIIDQYRRLPHASSNTFRDVRIALDDRGDIIQFYNRVFIPHTEQTLLQLHDAAKVAAAAAAAAATAAAAAAATTGAISNRAFADDDALSSTTAATAFDGTRAPAAHELLGSKLLMSPASPRRAVRMSPLRSTPASAALEFVSVQLNDARGLKEISEIINLPRRRPHKRLFSAT
jgi:hypothetical protein